MLTSPDVSKLERARWFSSERMQDLSFLVLVCRTRDLQQLGTVLSAIQKNMSAYSSC